MTVNEHIEKTLNANPLIGFSIYTHIQSEEVIALGREVLAHLDASLVASPEAPTVIRGEIDRLNRAYGRFWLWTLAAYEVIRTMSQAAQCFSAPLNQTIVTMKRPLSDLRMPFAKQELPGSKNKRPIGSEASICGIETNPADISFEVQGRVHSARKIITDFESMVKGIRREDVLADHRRSYSP